MTSHVKSYVGKNIKPIQFRRPMNKLSKKLSLCFLLFFSTGFSMTNQALDIVQMGQPILREKARSLTVAEIQSPKIQALIQAMRTTLHGKGVGLAAPQVGYSLQIAVIEDLPEYINLLPIEIQKERERYPIPFQVFINPQIIAMDTTKELFFEACLSIGTGARITPRIHRITVEFFNERGEKQKITAEGWFARILQHEIGHLNGTLFIDVADPRTEITLSEYKEKWIFANKARIQQYYYEKTGHEKI